MPERIQLRRSKGWRKPEGCVSVARPSRWGNWFRVSDRLPAERAVEFFRQDVVDAIEYGPKRPDTFDPIEPRARWIAEHLHELAGRDLACWCKPGEPCHADVLLELANPAPLEVVLEVDLEPARAAIVRMGEAFRSFGEQHRALAASLLEHLTMAQGAYEFPVACAVCADWCASAGGVASDAVVVRYGTPVCGWHAGEWAEMDRDAELMLGAAS